MNLRRSSLVLAVVLLAFGARLWGLEVQSIWWDEAISLHLATGDLGELLADRAAHVHPPLYFLLLKAWVALAGTSAFSARFLSVIFNVLLVAAAYAFARRRLGQRVGIASALVVALSPLYIIYSQEARVYALLPLAYLLVVDRGARLMDAAGPGCWVGWALLALVEVVGIHLHYVFLFAVIYVRLRLLISVQRRGAGINRWLLSAVGVVVAGLPWAALVLTNWGAVLTDMGSGDPLVEPVPLDHLFRLLWSFLWSGLTGAAGYPLLRTASYLVGGLLSIALVVLVAREGRKSNVVDLLAYWVVPTLASLALWMANPLAHPRYVIVFTSPLLIGCAYAVVKLGTASPVEQGLAILLAASIAFCGAVALRAYGLDPEFAKDDVRAVADWLLDRAGGDDVIVTPEGDWTLDFAYDGRAPILRPEATDADEVWNTLSASARPGSRVFLVGYPDVIHDRRRLLRFALESAGSLVEKQSFADFQVRVYRLDRIPARPPQAPADVQFGPLELRGSWIEAGAPADTAVTAALSWHLRQRVSPQLRVALSLVDTEGWTRASKDDWLLNDSGVPTDRWEAGETTTTYHVLPLPPGTPPLSYTLDISVYEMGDETTVPLDVLDAAGNPRGRSLSLTEVPLSSARGSRPSTYGVRYQVRRWDEPVRLTGGLVLHGATLDQASVNPGDFVFVGLRWRAEKAIETGRSVSLELVQRAPLVAQTIEVGGRYPVTRWSPGETVVTYHPMDIPSGAAEGALDVVLHWDDGQVLLGTIEVAASQHRFEPPPIAHEMDVEFDRVARLLGYDLPMGDLRAGEPVTVTLYWEALPDADDADYVVFTHLLDDQGRLVAQHDSRAVMGTRPSAGWMAGEILVDPHPMSFRESYAGPASVEIGLYRADSLDRVPAETGSDAVVLPTRLTVLPR